MILKIEVFIESSSVAHPTNVQDPMAPDTVLDPLDKQLLNHKEEVVWKKLNMRMQGTGSVFVGCTSTFYIYYMW